MAVVYELPFGSTRQGASRRRGKPARTDPSRTSAPGLRTARFCLVPRSWVAKAVAKNLRRAEAYETPTRSASDARLAINKPCECRSAVLLPPSFRPMPEGYILCPPSMRQRENRGWGLEEAWQPSTLTTYGPKMSLPTSTSTETAFLLRTV